MLISLLYCVLCIVYCVVCGVYFVRLCVGYQLSIEQKGKLKEKRRQKNKRENQYICINHNSQLHSILSYSTSLHFILLFFCNSFKQPTSDYSNFLYQEHRHIYSIISTIHKTLSHLLHFTNIYTTNQQRIKDIPHWCHRKQHICISF